VTSPRLAGVLLALSALAFAAENGGQERPRDAAEAVREGDVSQWLKYYQRERGMQPPAPAPENAPAPGEATGRSEPDPKR
jgi:hypothetical protein